MGQLDKIAKSIQSIRRIDGFAAIPPSRSRSVDASKTVAAPVGPEDDGSVLQDAETFEKAGWQFVSTESAASGSDQRTLFKGGDGRLLIDSRRLVVKFVPAADEPTIRKVLDSNGLSVVRRLGFGENLFLVKKAAEDDPTDVVELANRVALHDEIVYAEPELIEAVPPRA